MRWSRYIKSANAINPGSTRGPRIAGLSALAVASAAWIGFGAPTGGLYQLVRTLPASAGAGAKASGGSYSIVYSLGQPNTAAMHGGSFSLVSGAQSSQAVRRQLPPAPRVGAVIIPSPAPSGDIPKAVPLKAVITLPFDQPMDPASVVAAVSMTEARTGRPASFTAGYDPQASVLTIIPSPSWEAGTLYTLQVSTAARSLAGVALASPFAQPLETLAAAADVYGAYAFPVPWKPGAGDTARYGDLAGGITFTALPAEGSVRIHTLSGTLVREISIDGPTVKWFGNDDKGRTVAGGVYLWEVRSGGSRKTGKLMVVW